MSDRDWARTEPVATFSKGAQAYRMRELYRGALSKQTRMSPHAGIVLGAFCRPAVELKLSWSPPAPEMGRLDDRYDIVGLRLVRDPEADISALVASCTIGGSAQLYPETRHDRWLQLIPGMLYPVDSPVFVIAPNGAFVTVVCQLDSNRSLAIEIITVKTTPTTGRTP